VLHAARWKYRTQKIAYCTTLDNFVVLYLRELRPTNGWDRLVGLGHPSKFQRISRLGFVTAPTSLNGRQPNFARCLAVSWVGTCTFWGAVAPNGILRRAKFTLRPSLAFPYIDSVTARQSSSGRQLNGKICGVVSSRDTAAIPFDIGWWNFELSSSVKNWVITVCLL